MTDRLTIFSAPMVRALLDGRKIMTRRIVKNVPPMPSENDFVHEPRHERPYLDSYCGKEKTKANPRGMSDQWCWWTVDDRPGALFKVPYVPGDRLWVRETFYCDHYNFPKASVDSMRDLLDFRATHDCSNYEAGCPCDHKNWKPSIHMPRWASRLTLEVTGVNVERLQDISEADAVREGVYCFRDSDDDDRSPRDLFAALWRHLHGPDSWDANPFVSAISFTVHKCNIDKMGTP
jgi:hypothetical protein